MAAGFLTTIISEMEAEPGDEERSLTSANQLNAPSEQNTSNGNINFISDAEHTAVDTVQHVDADVEGVGNGCHVKNRSIEERPKAGLEAKTVVTFTDTAADITNENAEDEGLKIVGIRKGSESSNIVKPEAADRRHTNIESGENKPLNKEEPRVVTLKTLNNSNEQKDDESTDVAIYKHEIDTVTATANPGLKGSDSDNPVKRVQVDKRTGETGIEFNDTDTSEHGIDFGPAASDLTRSDIRINNHDEGTYSKGNADIIDSKKEEIKNKRELNKSNSVHNYNEPLDKIVIKTPNAHSRKSSLKENKLNKNTNASFHGSLETIKANRSRPHTYHIGASNESLLSGYIRSSNVLCNQKSRTAAQLDTQVKKKRRKHKKRQSQQSLENVDTLVGRFDFTTAQSSARADLRDIKPLSDHSVKTEVVNPKVDPFNATSKLCRMSSDNNKKHAARGRNANERTSHDHVSFPTISNGLGDLDTKENRNIHDVTGTFIHDVIDQKQSLATDTMVIDLKTPLGSAKPRFMRRPTYDAANSPTRLILLNNLYGRNSRLWRMPPAEKDPNRCQLIDPKRHQRESSIYVDGHFHGRCRDSPALEWSVRPLYKVTANLLPRPHSDNIGERLHDGKTHVNPKRHRKCRRVLRSAHMNFSSPDRRHPESTVVFEWERVYSEPPYILSRPTSKMVTSHTMTSQRPITRDAVKLPSVHRDNRTISREITH